MLEDKVLTNGEILDLAGEIVALLEEQTKGQVGQPALLAITFAASLFFNRQCELVFADC